MRYPDDEDDRKGLVSVLTNKGDTTKSVIHYSYDRAYNDEFARRDGFRDSVKLRE